MFEGWYDFFVDGRTVYVRVFQLAFEEEEDGNPPLVVFRDIPPENARAFVGHMYPQLAEKCSETWRSLFWDYCDQHRPRKEEIPERETECVGEAWRFKRGPCSEDVRKDCKGSICGVPVKSIPRPRGKRRVRL